MLLIIFEKIGIAIRVLACFILTFALFASNAEEYSFIKDDALSGMPEKMTLPVNPHDLWSRIINLLKIREGGVNNIELENILGLKMEPVDKNNPQNRTGNLKYMASENLPVLDRLKVEYYKLGNSTRIIWDLSWGGNFSDDYSCINIFQATADLSGLGWYPAPRSINGAIITFYKKTDWENYRKSGSVYGVSSKLPSLTIGFERQFSQCISGITVTI